MDDPSLDRCLRARISHVRCRGVLALDDETAGESETYAVTSGAPSSVSVEPQRVSVVEVQVRPGVKAVSRISAAERDARTKRVIGLELKYDNRLTALLSTKKFDSVLVSLSLSLSLSLCPHTQH